MPGPSSPDLATHPSFSAFAGWMDDVRCLIAVPLRFDDRAVGVLCAMQRRSRVIGGEDLALVQLFSQRVTSVLQAWVTGRYEDELPLRIGAGVAPRRGFEAALEIELRLLREQGGSLELAIVQNADLDATQAAVEGAAAPGRLLGGALGDGRIALFKSDASGSARTKLSALLAPLREKAGVRTGIVDLSEGVFSSLHADDLLRLAEQALDDATDSSSAVRRMVLVVEDA